MAGADKKTFRLSERALQIIENRDQSYYRHEYEFVEAAILNFQGERPEGDGTGQRDTDRMQIQLDRMKEELTASKKKFRK